MCSFIFDLNVFARRAVPGKAKAIARCRNIVQKRHESEPSFTNLNTIDHSRKQSVHNIQSLLPTHLIVWYNDFIQSKVQSTHKRLVCCK